MINELTKQERICLLHMLYLAETVDGVLDSREEELLKVYADKLGLRCNQEDLKKFKNLSLSDELENIKTYEQRKKKILFSEIVAVMFSDGIYDDKEKAFMKTVGVGIGINEELILAIENAVMEYMKAYNTLVEIVNI